MRVIDIAPIPGDPAGMRHTAQRLEQLVADLRQLSGGVLKAGHDMKFRSDFSTRLRTALGEMTSEATGQCGVLSLIAGDVRVTADQVETAQQHRLDTINRLRADEAARLQGR